MKRAKSKFLELIDGGERIIMPLEYAQIASSDWYEGSDLLGTTDNQTIQGCELLWKQIYGNVSINRREELQNSGRSQVVSLVKSKVKTCEKTVADKIATGMYNAGSTAKAIIGLRAWINTSSTVGGISQSTNSWWQAGDLDSTTTALTLGAMQTVDNACTIDNETPSVVLAGRTVFNLFYSLLTPVQRFVDKETARAGFQSLFFNGKPAICDSKCPALNMIFLNENFIHLYGHKQEWFRHTPMQTPVNQNVKTSKVYNMLAFGSSNNRMHGRLSAIAS
jgi:hypothetical protein